MAEVRRSSIFGLGSVLMAVLFIKIGAPIRWIIVAVFAGALALTE